MRWISIVMVVYVTALHAVHMTPLSSTQNQQSTGVSRILEERKCGAGFYWNTVHGMCWRRRDFSSSCLSHADCDGHLICSNNTCSCPAEYPTWNTYDCVKVTSDACYVNSDCVHAHICVNHTCVCSSQENTLLCKYGVAQDKSHLHYALTIILYVLLATTFICFVCILQKLLTFFLQKPEAELPPPEELPQISPPTAFRPNFRLHLNLKPLSRQSSNVSTASTTSTSLSSPDIIDGEVAMEPIWFEDEEPRRKNSGGVIKNLPESVITESPLVKNDPGWKYQIKKQSSKIKFWLPTYDESVCPPSYDQAMSASGGGPTVSNSDASKT